MSLYPCTISLGSNSYDRESKIKEGIEILKGYLSNAQVSSIYETNASNGTDMPYLNAVIHGETSHAPDEIVGHLKHLEKEAGRTPELKREGIVPLDLDLIIYDNRILRPEDFQKHYFNKGYRQLLSKGAFETI